ncbi:tetratricopeptide repeat protein [Chitinibacter sp. ZOR0017]|uniref:tetratricopeptide repeat protein n=1 Tax=Chitinibacter sp. ZOR0017 TaxID=1339254 RepID=UPI00068B9629|nr:tetratricopeptide repeat protein [Chitinibacter sp. ZOR0017]
MPAKVRAYSFVDRAPIAAADEPVSLDDLSAFRILVIDHIPEMRATLSMTLNQFGAQALEYASRSGEALGMLRRTPYDIILCAYDLGTGFDGLYLFEEARRHGLLKASCVFVMLTGERQSSKVIGAAELAPDAIVLKPFTGDTLFARVQRALRKKQRFKPIDAAIIAHDFLRAISLCEREISEGGDDTLDFVRMKVHLLLRIADWHATRDLCRSLLARSDLAWAKMALGKALFQLREYDEAQQIFRQVMSEHELVLEAYDWLARVQQAQHQVAAAKLTLSQAVHKSPYVVNRMRELGEVALAAGDVALAEQSLTETVRLARFSFWPQVSDYSQLAELQIARGDVGAARKTAATIKRDFRQGPEAVLAEVLEADVLLKLGDRSKAAVQLDQALHTASLLIEPPTAAVALGLAKSCLAQNRHEQARQLTLSVLKNRHDDPQLAAKVTRMYQQQGREEEALQMIEETAANIVEINNEAVLLAKQGNLQAAAERFLAAVKDMPANLQVLLNTINALLAYVNQHGWHDSYMQRAKELLTRVSTLDPANGKGLQMAEIFRKTQRRFGIKG